MGNGPRSTVRSLYGSMTGRRVGVIIGATTFFCLVALVVTSASSADAAMGPRVARARAVAAARRARVRAIERQVKVSAAATAPAIVSSPAPSRQRPSTPTSHPTCLVSGLNDARPDAQMSFTVQDSVSGVAAVKVIRHLNSIGSISSFSMGSISSFTPGTTSPVTATFTKKVQTAGSNAGVKAINEDGVGTSCGGQYKFLRRGRVGTQGFTFRRSYDDLMIQNGSKGLRSVSVTLNGSTFGVVLTAGESFTETLSGLSKTNTMVVEGFGKARTSAVVAVWGTLP